MSREVNIVMLGSNTVGKSAIVVQLMSAIFEEEYHPTGDEQYTVMFEYQGSTVKLNVFDTSGSEANAASREEKYGQADGFIAVYSIASKESLDELKQFLEKVKEVKGSKPVSVVLVGNKLDLEENRVVQKGEGEQYAAQLECPFAEISAKDRENVTDVFNRLLAEIDKNTAAPKEPEKPPKKKGGCCEIL